MGKKELIQFCCPRIFQIFHGFYRGDMLQTQSGKTGYSDSSDSKDSILSQGLSLEGKHERHSPGLKLQLGINSKIR